MTARDGAAPPATFAVGLFALLLAGCASPPPASNLVAFGSQPVVFLGYDYAGASAHPGAGTFHMDTDASRDTGRVAANFDYLGHTWQAEFVQFQEAPGRSYQEGGIRTNFQEHGATGNGDALLPGLHALSAGWGVGTLSVDGGAFPDPATGNASFAMHYMLTDTAPRDPATHKITKADGAAPYDPATPGDAKTWEGTRQFMLNIQSRGPAPPPPWDANFSDSVQGPNYARSWPFEVNATTAHAFLNFTVTSSTPAPLSVGQVSFVVLDPAGQAVGRSAYDPLQNPGQSGAGMVEMTPPLTPGTYTVRVEGTGAALTYGIHVTITYPDAFFLHVVYGDVRLGN